MIKIFDDIIPEYFQDFICNFITGKTEGNSYPLHYMDNLTFGGDSTTHGYEVGFGSNFFSGGRIMHIGGPLLTPLFLFLNSQKLILRELIHGKVFLQIPNTCLDHPQEYKLHKDQHYDHLVMLYYATDTDGDTYFYNDKEGKDIITQVSPKKGRIVFFDGNIWHSGSNTTKDLRIVLNYNFLI